MRSLMDGRQSRPMAWLGGLLLFGALMFSACQPVQPPAVSDIPEFTVSVSDDAVTVPEVVPGGIVRMTVRNNSSRPLDIGIGRVLEGSTAEEVIALAQGGEEAFVPLLTKASFLPSFNPIASGAAKSAIMDLRTGEFIVDATEHVEGMPVTGAPHLNAVFTANQILGTTEPAADVVVDMVDFAYVMPDELKAGPQRWEFKNDGDQWHMMFVVSLADGATAEDVLAALSQSEPSGPPPFDFVADAGTTPIGAGERIWLDFDLPPGQYLLGCPLPDLTGLMAGEAPMSHMKHGMMKMVEVTE